ncbi:tape measure protein [Levilactobacillus namurensis]|uniref:tape measure protein n=1 Tax=Levilactobacillus namurensis TaxID=380393 RepID=UPI001D5F6F6A|nr:tape measure protein [Levilactobacillus namurensis]HJE44469.1 tape measure protein [Levilactobacillus namurensis]
MGSTVSATIKINDAFSGPLDKLSAGLARGSSAMGNLSKGASGTGSMFKSVLGGTVIGAGITRGIGAIGSGLRSMYGELNDSKAAWETFEGNMKAFGKGNQIKSVQSDLSKFAVKTIYSASDMASTYSQLEAVGTKNTKALVKGFGGLAAASDNPRQAMKTLSQQATQAASKPKLMWQDLRFMMEQTPGGIAAVAKTMHKTSGQLVQDVQAGKVKTQDFFDAIAKAGNSDAFQKMATKYKTIPEALGGLKEELAVQLRDPWAKVTSAVNKSIVGLTDKMGTIDFSGITDGIVPVVQSIVDAVKTAGQAVGAFWDSLSSTGAVSAVKSTIGDMLSKLSSGGGKDPFAMFKTLGSISGGAIKGLANGIGAISRAVGQLPPSSIKLLAGAFVALKMSTRGLVFTAVVAGLTALSKLNPGTLNALAKAVTVLAIAFAMFKGLQNVVKIISDVKGSLSGLGGRGGLGNTTKQAPQAAAGFIKLGASLVLVGGAVVLAGAGMMLLAKATITLVDAGWPAIAVFAAMVAGIIILAVVVANLGVAMLDGAVGFAVFAGALLLIGFAVLLASAGIALLATQLPTIATYGAQAAGALVLLGAAMAVFGVLSVVAAVGLVLLGAGLAIVGIGFAVAAVGALLFGVAMALVAVMVTVAAVGMLLLAVALPLIAVTSMVAAVGMMLMAVALVMLAAVAMVAGAGMMIFALALVIAAPLMMIAAVGAVMLGAAAIVLGAGLIVAGAGLMVVAAGLRSVISAVSAMVSAFVNGVTRLISAVTDGMSQVVSAVRGGMQRAVSAAKSFGSALFGAGVDLIKGLVNGIKSMVHQAVAAVQNVAKSVVSAAKNAMGIGSPSKIFKQYGVWVVQGLANGLNANNAAETASAGMARRVVDAAQSLNHMPTLNPGDVLADGFNRAYDAVMGVAGAVRGISGQTIGVMGQVSGLDGATLGGPVPSTASGVPSSTPFTDETTPYTVGASYSSSATSTNSTGNTINIAPGAFQVTSTGDADYDVETLVEKFEDYLMNLKERRG